MRKPMKCRGTMPGTNKPCNEILCETDGTVFFVKLESGSVYVLKLKRGLTHSFICGACGRETFLVRQAAVKI